MRGKMSAFESNNPLDLLGQAPPSAPSVQLRGATEPQLELGWGQFHQGVASNFAELFRRARVSKLLLSASVFKDILIERRVPRRAIFAAALWHIAFIALPFPQISGPKHNPAFDNMQLTWSGPVVDFPLLEIHAAKPRSISRVAQTQPAASEGADAFHPRQRIFTDPSRPTHPRQTLINPAAPPVAPKILPNLPNIVQLAQSVAPTRPHLEISQETLKKLRPRERKIPKAANAIAPEVQMNEQRSALNLAMANSGPERPKLQINAGVAPRAAQRSQQSTSELEPEVAASQLTSPNGGTQALIALSANPGPPAPVAPPPGNLAARVAISPEGKKSGASGGAEANANAGGNSGGASGTNSVAVSISGGAPRSANTISGIGAGKLSLPSSRPNYSRAEALRETDEPTLKTSPPNFAMLAPGAKPEAIFARRRVYSMNVNMPNLNSATGSWIMNFAEMRISAPGAANASGEIAEPAPLHKVDPKYPPTLIADHVEGEVILYAVIRRDGSVDSIQVVHGIDPQLDANSMHALAQWKFRPAERNGETVDLETIVHIPFHAPER